MGHKTNFNEFKKIEDIQCCCQTTMKLKEKSITKKLLEVPKKHGD